MSASAFDIAASGMAAHRAEMDLIAENIANAGTVRPGAAFRPHAAVIAPAGDQTFADMLDSALDGDPDQGWTTFASSLGGGYAPTPVTFAGVVDEPASPENDSIGEMVSLVAAGRAYDADVASLQAAKQMDVEAIDMERA